MQCPNCQKALQGDFKFCPYCGVEVVNSSVCRTCHKQVEPAWVSCPYCGSDLKAPPAARPPHREQPPQRPPQQPHPPQQPYPQHPPYSHGGHYYGSSSDRHYRKRKGFLGRLFS